MSVIEEQMRALARDGDVEGMLVLGLDRDGQPCGVALNPHHRALSFVKVWELSALTEELDASALMIAVFPRGGPRTPTEHEVAAFVDLRARAQRAQVVLLDCLVARGDRVWSLRESCAGSLRC